MEGPSVGVRRLGLISVVVLVAQFVLGMAVNLWVSIGSVSPWSHISDIALFAVHAGLGVAVVVLAFVVLTKAFEEDSRRDRSCASLALLGILGAFGCGIGFVSSGGSAGYSFGMSIGWAVALLANVVLTLQSSDSEAVPG
jgi:hypothetical protein